MNNPAHPGAVLRDMLPMTVGAFAAHIGVSRNTLSRILNEHAAVTPEMSIKFAEAFGQPTLSIWFQMQNNYDFWKASQKKRRKISKFERKGK
ncbi:MAG TPA: HigA family addiction module antitoxin [Edaphobacter sp.]|nr:HigA family addiction module antitoxin [Edaphobacter sp.]